jgi:hypothetical protein
MQHRTGLLIAAAALLGAASLVAAELPWSGATNLATSLSDPSSLDVGDLDGDGDLDLVFTEQGAGTLSWLENDGSGAFAAAAAIDGGLTGVDRARIVDLDRDGDRDVLVVGPGLLLWLDNAGDASAFTDRPVAPDVLTGGLDAASGDIDGDGDIDVLAAGASFFGWYPSDGAATPTFTKATIDSGTASPGGVALGDLDSDGDLDAILTGDDAVSWWENDGAATPGWTEHTVDSELFGAGSVALGDADGDGSLDVLASADTDADELVWYLNVAGDGSSWTPQVLASGGTSVSGWVRAVDVDRDGDLDAAIPRDTDDDLAWFENLDGTATSWAERSVAGSRDAPTDLLLFDFDADGDLDAVAADDGLDQVDLWSNDRIHGAAWLGFEGEISVGLASVNDLRSADLDGDGDIDLVGSGDDGTDELVFWWENVAGDGSSWTQHQICGPLGGGTCWEWVREVAIGDLDGDGDLDVVTTWFTGPGRAAWYRNEGDAAAWTDGGTIANIGFGANGADIADIDGDGDNDVLLTDRSSDYVGWAENDDGLGGSWSWHEAGASLLKAETPRAADIDGDGDLDIVAAAHELCDAAWWENDGGAGDSWTYHLVADLGTNDNGCGIHMVDAADMDQDGDIDILVSVPGLNLLNWYENLDGSGDSWSPNNIGTPDGGAIDLGDFDHDGDIDVVRAGDGGMQWYESAFSAQMWTEHTLTSSNSSRVEVADFDGDGALDVATFTGEVRWYRNDFTRLDAAFSDESPATLDETAEDAAFAILVEHQGISTDWPLELARVGVKFESFAGSLTSVQAGSLVEELTLWLDDGDGFFEPSEDSLFETVASGDLALTDGVHVIEVTESAEDAQLDPDAGVATFFVAVELTWDASLQGIDPLQMTLVAQDTDFELLGADIVEPHGLEDEGPAPIAIVALDSDEDGDPDHTDCDDENAAIYTDAPESCDSIDSDCDDSIVDEDPDFDGDLTPDCIDLDDDDDLDPDVTDCGDLDAAIYTGAPESCDLVDSDCDGSLVDEDSDLDGDGIPDCVDDDDDGDGDPDATDCSDTNAAIYNGAPESCDGIDSNCNGSLVDTFTDTDGDFTPDCIDLDDDADGDPDTTDCDDVDATVYTGAAESCDAIDSDCDGSIVDEDPDFDGDLTPDCVDDDDDGDGDPDVTDCAQLDAAIYTGAPETCDLVDSDCNGSLVDGSTDFDGDLTPDCVDDDDDDDGDPDVTDCADLDATIYTGATELCDDIDSDCDGLITDGFEDTDGDGDPDCFDDDDDDDGLPDEYELAQGLDPLDAGDADDDPDLDGRVHLLEYGDGTDPWTYDGPGVPLPLEPIDVAVDTNLPELVIDNVEHPLGDDVVYAFEVYADAALTELLVGIVDIDEEAGETDWIVNAELPDDAMAWWRAAASDAFVQGAWSEPVAVFVNTNEAAPAGGPFFVSPADGDALSSVSPTLVASEASDAEGGPLTYRFAVNTVAEFDVGEDLEVVEVPGDGSGAVVLSLAAAGITLDEDRSWHLQVRAEDPTGALSEADVIEVFVRGVNDPPSVPEVLRPAAGDLEGSPLVIEIEAASDPEGDAVSYDYVVATTDDLVFVTASAEDVTETTVALTVPLAGPVYVSARAKDDGGATSAWSVPIALEVEAGHGCPSGDGAEAAFLLLLGGPLLLGMRRRRRRKGSRVPPWLALLPLLAACVLPTADEVYEGIETGDLPDDGAQEVDEDGDGALVDDDCDDADPARFPGNQELCDGVDNDCDDALGADETDADGDGEMVCEGDCDDDDDGVGSGADEQCDGADEDCDGVVDEEPIDPCPCHQAIREETGSSYLLCETSTTFDGIDALCATGYGPASLADEGEWTFVVAAAADSWLDRPWIGLSAADDGSPFEWSDGTPLDYEHWAPDEPADGLCVQLGLPGPGSWVTADCDAPSSFVCEASP